MCLIHGSRAKCLMKWERGSEPTGEESLMMGTQYRWLFLCILKVWLPGKVPP